MDNHIISIIIPVYNVEDYVDYCLSSIVDQTYKNLEIIIVNDGSTDRSLDILEKYSQFDSRIILVNQENRGLSSARNTGLDLASGEFVLFVDSDDWLDVDTCERLLRVAFETNSDVVIFGLMHVGSGWKRERKQFEFQFPLLGEIYLLTAMSLDGFTPTSCNKFFKKIYIEDVRFPLDLRYEDIFFSTAILSVAKKVYFERSIFYYYRKNRKNSITGCVGIENYKDLKNIYSKLEEFLNEIGKEKIFSSDVFQLNKFERFSNEIIMKLIDGKRIVDKNKIIDEIRDDQFYREMSKFYTRHGKLFFHKLISNVFLFNPRLLIVFKVLFILKKRLLRGGIYRG